MILVAKQKHNLPNVLFEQADLTKAWHFKKADLVACSLVLEHIRNISHIFEQAYDSLQPNGQFYICELHPYKQMQGSRAKFELNGALIQLEYFVHQLSDFFQSARENGFSCVDMQEWFDTNDRNQIPRLCSFLFERN
jgi:2-polyprenyl-3-methyl-5-hydroxy-6-metoxy-1,4-benzoquinol methylase